MPELKPSVQPIYSVDQIPGTMPIRFMPLARYNSRISEGIVHEDDFVDKMKALQKEYDSWYLRTYGRKY